MHCIIIFFFGTVATFPLNISTRILGTEIYEISVPQKSSFFTQQQFSYEPQKNSTIYLRYLPPCKIRRRIRKSYLFFQEKPRSKVRAAQRSKKQQKSMISRIAPTLERPCNRGRIFLGIPPHKLPWRLNLVTKSF